MDPLIIKTLLRSLGISGIVLFILAGTALVLYGYRTLLETQKLKLEVEILKKQKSDYL